MVKSAGFVLSVPALIFNGPKKVFQYFAEEETRNLPEIIKKVEIFPGALRHFRIYVYTTASSVSSSVHSAHVLTMQLQSKLKTHLFLLYYYVRM